MTPGEFSQIEMCRREFGKLTNLLNELQRKSWETEDYIIFAKHKYTQKQLLEDPVFARIESVVGTISFNILSWVTHNGISEDFYNVYNSLRISLENHASNVQFDIARRTPTAWEKFAGAISNLFSFILKKLPKLIINHYLGGGGPFRLGE